MSEWIGLLGAAGLLLVGIVVYYPGVKIGAGWIEKASPWQWTTRMFPMVMKFLTRSNISLINLLVVRTHNRTGH